VLASDFSTMFREAMRALEKTVCILRLPLSTPLDTSARILISSDSYFIWLWHNVSAVQNGEALL
ncbi:MAG: hypothetical protein AAFR25_10835, partial [Cyanobacteria bacterium J06629_19]